MDAEQKKYIDLLVDEPIKVGHWVGFDKLTDLHNKWMIDFIRGNNDTTKLSHRGSYKTTSLSIAIPIIMTTSPNENIMFVRKTDSDTVEIISQIKKMLEHDFFQHVAYKIYGKPLKLLKTNQNEITTNLPASSRGTVQLLGIGTKASLTGKHFDKIFTDDIVNLKDRISAAERRYTKQVYGELQNIKNRGGRIINTGTVWHKEDCISLMPNIEIYDCYSTGLISRVELEEIRKSPSMTPSLFAANYELLHIASEDALFTTSPNFEPDGTKLHNGLAHIDASYGGADGSALTLLRRDGDKIYILGKLRHKHIDDCLDEYLTIKNHYLCGSIHTENNADKGYLAKEIRRRGDKAMPPYHENMNKYIKISTYLKKYWNQLYFIEDTDPEYINQIMDYTEDAEHDDCPDSASSLLRKIDRVKYTSLT